MRLFEQLPQLGMDLLLGFLGGCAISYLLDVTGWHVGMAGLGVVLVHRATLVK